MKKLNVAAVLVIAFAFPLVSWAQEATPSPTPAALSQAEILSQQKEIITRQKDLLDAQRAYLDVFKQASGSGLADRDKAGGKTDYRSDSTVAFETVVLSYDALKEIAARIDDQLKPVIARYNRLAIYYEPDFNALSRYRLYREQARTALENYDAFIKQLNDEAAKAHPSGGVQIKTLDDNGGLDFLTGLSAPGIATAAVRSVAELISLFRTDREITSYTATMKPEVAGTVVSGTLMKAHPDLTVYNPEMFVPEYDIGIGDKRSFYEDIARLNAAEAYMTYFLDESSKLPEKVQNTPPLSRLIAQAKVVRSQVSGLSFTLKPNALSSTEQADNTEFRRMVRAEKLDRFLRSDGAAKSGIMKISLLSSGGSRRESRNLLLGSKTDYSGSAVVEVAIYDVDGTMRASEVFSYHTGFRKFSTQKQSAP